MDATTIIAISELLKLSMTAYASYMQQQGLTDEQINTMFDEARAAMLLRDPNKLPE